MTPPGEATADYSPSPPACCRAIILFFIFLVEPRCLYVFVSTGQSDTSIVPRIPIVSDIPVVAINSKARASIWRCSVVHKPVVIENLPEVTAAHINEDGVFLEIVAYILACRGVELPIDFVSDVLTTVVE